MDPKKDMQHFCTAKKSKINAFCCNKNLSVYVCPQFLQVQTTLFTLTLITITKFVIMTI